MVHRLRRRHKSPPDAVSQERFSTRKFFTLMLSGIPQPLPQEEVIIQIRRGHHGIFRIEHRIHMQVQIEHGASRSRLMAESGQIEGLAVEQIGAGVYQNSGNPVILHPSYFPQIIHGRRHFVAVQLPHDELRGSVDGGGVCHIHVSIHAVGICRFGIGGAVVVAGMGRAAQYRGGISKQFIARPGCAGEVVERRTVPPQIGGEQHDVGFREDGVIGHIGRVIVQRIIVVVAAVHSGVVPDLLHVAQTAGQFCLFPRLVQCGQQHRRQNGDDGDYDHYIIK